MTTVSLELRGRTRQGDKETHERRRREERRHAEMCTVQRQVSVGRRWGRVLMSSEKRLVFWAEVASLCGGDGCDVAGGE